MSTKDKMPYSVLDANSVPYFSPGGSSSLMNEAGVDSMGLLTGVIAMTTLKDRVYAADASLPAARLDAYFALTPSVTGLNDKGEPLADATVHPAV